MSLRDITLLTPEECEKVARTVHELRGQWIQQHPVLPTYTLGASAGNKGSLFEYFTLVQRCNPILKEHFGWVYERMSEVLEQEFGVPFTTTPAFGLPGFVLYIAPKVIPHSAPKAAPPLHRDLQYMKLNWESYYSEIDRKVAMSMTGSIRLPEAGSGLYYWDISPEDAIARGLCKEGGLAPPEALEGVVPRDFHEYTAGHLAVVPSYLMHQAALLPFKGGEERITLQTHFLFCDGAWRMYF